LYSSSPAEVFGFDQVVIDGFVPHRLAQNLIKQGVADADGLGFNHTRDAGEDGETKRHHGGESPWDESR
jgi:hypothetical protein